jgi:transposase-like protein
LSSSKLKEVLNFVHFIKAKEAIDPTQAYFWTKKWQEGEREADKDKEPVVLSAMVPQRILCGR